jgi:hypothetical protein
MQAADTMEKASRENTALPQAHKAELLGLLAGAEQQEVRWHLAVIVPRLRLTASEGRRVVKMLRIYLEDRSSKVRTFAMQGPAYLAMRARGRKILRQLEQSKKRIHSQRSATTGSTAVARRAGM